MTASIPNGFSPEDLQNLLENAPQEEDLQEREGTDGECGYYGDSQCTAEEITRKAAELLDEMSEFCSHPIAHKAMAMMVLANFIEWQTEMGVHNDNCVGWIRDAGKAQACHQIFKSITASSNDFIAEA